MAEFCLVPKVSQWGKKPIQVKTVLDEDGRPIRRKPIEKKALTEQAVKDNLLDTKILQKHLQMLEVHKNRRLHQIDREVIETQRFLDRLSAQKQSLRRMRESAEEFGYSYVLQQILKSMGLPTEVPTFKPADKKGKRSGRKSEDGSRSSSRIGGPSPASLASQKSPGPPGVRVASAVQSTRSAGRQPDMGKSSVNDNIQIDFDIDSSSDESEKDDVSESDDTSIHLSDDGNAGKENGERRKQKGKRKVTFTGVDSESDSEKSEDNVTETTNATGSAQNEVDDTINLPWELRRLRWTLATREQPKSPEFQSPAILKWKQILKDKKKCPEPECTLHGKRYSRLKRRGDSSTRLSSVQSLNSYPYYYDDGRPYRSHTTKFPTLPPGWNSATSDHSRRSITPGTTMSTPSPNIFADLDSEGEDEDAEIDWGTVDAISSVRRPMRGSNRDKMMVYKEASLRNAFEIMRKRVAAAVPAPFNKNYGEPTPNWKILNPLKLRHQIFHKSPLYVKWKM